MNDTERPDPTITWIGHAAAFCFGMATGLWAVTHDPELAFVVPTVAFLAGVIVAVLFMVGDFIHVLVKGR